MRSQIVLAGKRLKRLRLYSYQQSGIKIRAWRMDIQIDIDSSDDEYDDKNNESDCYAEEFSDSEGESSMSVGSD